MKYIKTFEQVNNGRTFKEWLKDYPQDINAERIDCTDYDLIDLNDIEQFKNLQYLYCYNNKLTELPDLSNLVNLEVLNSYNNKLPYYSIGSYKEWHEKNYPWIYKAKDYGL